MKPMSWYRGDGAPALSDTSKPISPVTVRTCTVTEKSC